MNKGILYATPLAAFTLTVIKDFESNQEPLDSITLMQDEMAQLMPMLIDTHQINQLMVVGLNKNYIEGIGYQLIDILKDKKIEIIVAISSEEENAEISD